MNRRRLHDLRGDLAQLGRANELELGVELLNEVKIRKVFIPGEQTGTTTWARSGSSSSTSPLDLRPQGVRLYRASTRSPAARTTGRCGR